MADLLSRAITALRVAAPDGFFVGGCVRDWLMGRPLNDLDIALPDHVEETGRTVAAALEGVFFWLREAMQVGRVIVRADSPLQIDLVLLADSLEEDLRRRDFTINAMAVPAREGLVPGAPIIDPTGGREDLAGRRLRLAAPDALERDPLRCLRAFRLRTVLGLTFAPGLETAIEAAGPSLARISGERIRDELFVLLEGDQSAPVIADLLAHDLVAPWSAALAASAAGEEMPAADRASGVALLEQVDRWLATKAPLLACAEDLQATLETRVTPPRSRRALARLAALSTEAGSATPSIACSLCLSTDETRIVTRAVGGAAALKQAWPAAGSDRLRFSQRWEPGAVEAALLALAAGDRGQGTGDREPHEGPTSPRSALLSYLLERRLRPVPPLLTGEEIMRICRLAPGPEVGRYLQQLEEERADGLLRTPEQARAWLMGCESLAEREVQGVKGDNS